MSTQTFESRGYTSPGAHSDKYDLRLGRHDIDDREWAVQLALEMIDAGIKLPNEIQAGDTVFTKEQILKMLPKRG